MVLQLVVVIELSIPKQFLQLLLSKNDVPKVTAQLTLIWSLATQLVVRINNNMNTLAQQRDFDHFMKLQVLNNIYV